MHLCICVDMEIFHCTRILNFKHRQQSNVIIISL